MIYKHVFVFQTDAPLDQHHHNLVDKLFFHIGAQLCHTFDLRACVNQPANQPIKIPNALSNGQSYTLSEEEHATTNNSEWKHLPHRHNQS